MNHCMDDCTCGQETDCGCGSETVTLQGRVLQVCACWLLVCDLSDGQRVRVNTSQACCFSVGECVCVTYNGAMTTSIPPQISADSICRIACC